MAGIGFVLLRLARRDDLSGAGCAFLAAAAITSGPWLLTILGIVLAERWAGLASEPWEHEIFRLVLSYNFCASLVLTAPVAAVTARLLADDIFAGRGERAGALMLHALGAALLLQVPPMLAFWFLAIDLAPEVQTAAAVNYVATVGLWLGATFMAVLREFRTVLLAFAGGICLAAALAGPAAGWLGAAGLLAAFALGATVVLFAAAVRVFAELPYRPVPFGEVVRAAWAHRPLALVGLLGAAAPWADKWVLWLSPDAHRHPSGLLDYPLYDSAMFIAYLAMLPGVATFYLAMESELFVAFRRFFDDLLRGATLDRIQARGLALTGQVASALFALLLLQGTVCALVLLASPGLVEWGLLTPSQHPPFRLGVLGTLFHVVVLAMLTVMSYLDGWRQQLATLLFFIAANAGLTLATLLIEDAALGQGYVAATALTLALASTLVAQMFGRLPYVVFVAHNPSLRR